MLETKILEMKILEMKILEMKILEMNWSSHWSSLQTDEPGQLLEELVA